MWVEGWGNAATTGLYVRLLHSSSFFFSFSFLSQVVVGKGRASICKSQMHFRRRSRGGEGARQTVRQGKILVHVQIVTYTCGGGFNLWAGKRKEEEEGTLTAVN